MNLNNVLLYCKVIEISVVLQFFYQLPRGLYRVGNFVDMFVFSTVFSVLSPLEPKME